MVSPPRPKGPPLNALRAFEAAARLGGFAAAANELLVTPGAIAQHIKTLESWIGDDLFVRKSQGVRLTRLGEGVAGEFCIAFDRLGEAVDKLRNLAPRTEIRIATLPSIAQLWLSPRMPAIRDAVRQTTFSIIATEAPLNLLREPVDLNLFFEPKDGRPNSIQIAQDFLYPVCAPHSAAAYKNLEDLSAASFLHDSTWSEDWQHWLEEQPVKADIDTRGATYSLYALAVEEAINGSGLLMGHDVLVNSHVQNGQLVALFDFKMPLETCLTVTFAKPPVANSALAKVIAVLQSS